MWRCNYTSSYIKVDLCAHTDSKNGIFTRRVLTPYIFDSYTPSPFCAGSSWGLLSRKIFLFFSRYNSILFFFKLSTFRLAVIFYLCVILVWFPVEFNYLVYITISGFDYNFGFCVFDSIFRPVFTRYIFLASISTCFSIVYSTLYLLNSLSLWLFCLL